MTARTSIYVAAHVHSEWSYDAAWTLDALAEAFAKRGYRAALMTEHDRGYSEERRLEHRAACARASTDRVLLIPGIEYSDADNTVHILVWGDVPFAGEARVTKELLLHVAAHCGVAVLAHPTRKNAWQRVGTEWYDMLAGVEIWNRKSDGWCASADGVRLINGTITPAWVGLDFHRSRQFFPLAMALQIESGSDITEEGVLNAIREHRLIPIAMGMDARRFVQGPLRWVTLLVDRARRTALRLLSRKW